MATKKKSKASGKVGKTLADTLKDAPDDGLLGQLKRHHEKLEQQSSTMESMMQSIAADQKAALESTSKTIEETRRSLEQSSDDDVNDLITRANVILARISEGGPVAPKDRRAAFIAFTFAYSKMIADFGLDPKAAIAELEVFIESELAAKGEVVTETTTH